MTNYYHVLGLSEDASAAEIKAAFKRLAVKYHPDKHPGRPEMEEKFKEINLAHQVLSDEYEKARFDLKLKYQQFSYNQQPPPYSYEATRTHTRSARPRPRYYYQPRVDYRQNAIATAYAFGITFLIALVVMTGIWAKQTYDNHQLEKRLAERRTTFAEAKKYFEDGDYHRAFEMMASLNFFRKEELDMKAFKENMLNEIIEKGDNWYSQGKFDEAITLYRLVEEFEPELPHYNLKKQLAEAYLHTNQPIKAIEVLKKFLLSEYETIHSLTKISDIYYSKLNNPHEALDYLLTAHRLAVKRYKAFYGDGYALVINEKHVPKSHYYLYTHLADMYLEVGEEEMAIKAADWNKYVWPDSASSYVTSAKAYIALGQKDKACMEYQGAIARNWTEPTSISCN